MGINSKEANAAKLAWRQAQAPYLHKLSDGQLGVFDLIELAATNTQVGEALRRLHLKAVLEVAYPKGASAARKMERLQTTLGRKVPRYARLSWLLDPKAEGTRFLALVDVLTRNNQAVPWPGFPYPSVGGGQ